jgi:chromate transporter
VAQIFGAFLILGATSIGGGIVAYLRNGLVTKRRWLDDTEFIRVLSISQSLPGLNATNIAILVGDRLRGALGATVAIIGMFLPGALIMFGAGVAYGAHGERPLVTAALHGIAAAASGLTLAVTLQLGRKSLGGRVDLGLVALTVVVVNVLHLGVLEAVIGVGALAIFCYRPRRDERPTRVQRQEPVTP